MIINQYFITLNINDFNIFEMQNLNDNENINDNNLIEENLGVHLIPPFIYYLNSPIISRSRSNINETENLL